MKARAALTDSTRDLKDKLCPMFDLNPCYAVHLWPRSLVATIFFDECTTTSCWPSSTLSTDNYLYNECSLGFDLSTCCRLSCGGRLLLMHM